MPRVYLPKKGQKNMDLEQLLPPARLTRPGDWKTRSSKAASKYREALHTMVDDMYTQGYDDALARANQFVDLAREADQEQRKAAEGVLLAMAQAAQKETECYAAMADTLRSQVEALKAELAKLREEHSRLQALIASCSSAFTDLMSINRL
jgi:polyhydroxyalkanoate synthesis regulator phasin